jgi:1-acyl-sn-glycerol-3-phosphate acyltransferase
VSTRGREVGCGMGQESDEGDRSLLGRLETAVGNNVEEASDPSGRDPRFIRSIMPAVDVALRWFAPEVNGFHHLPADGPFLVVGNHSGGVFMPDYWAFLREWVRRRGAEAPLYSLGFDFLFSIPGTGSFARRMGSVPARHETGEALLADGATVLVYPGGDEDDYRPWTDRGKVDLHGHMGFVRLALRAQVPVVPLVSHGSHDSLIVVFRGGELAHALKLDRLRIHVLPVVLGPTGLVPLPLAGPPLPAKVLCRVCEPFDWTHLPPEAADDDETVRQCYEEVLGRMQAALDELVAELPHPIRTRIGDALGLDRLRRALAFGRSGPDDGD